MASELYYIWLNEMRGLPNHLKVELLGFFKTPEEIFKADIKDLPEKYLNYRGFSEYFTSKNLKRSKKILDANCKGEIKILTANNPAYLPCHKRNKRTPLLLYFKGNLPDWSRSKTAIVGSRRATPYGKAVAKIAVREAIQGCNDILSGMAVGIDSIVHEVTFEEKGNSIAFLANGLDICYPSENIRLMKELEERGTIISPFPVGTPPLKTNFYIRNEILTTWADSIILIEGSLKSGSVMTGDLGIKNKRDVYVVPNNIFMPQSAGCNMLLTKGAKPYLGQMEINNKKIRGPKGKLPNDPILLSLIEGEKSAETLAHIHEKTIDQVNEILTEYELEDKVKYNADGKWHFIGWE